MKKSFCDIHMDEEEKYICIHPNCIKEKENKPICGVCFDKHAVDRTEFHQKVSLYILFEKAKINKEAYIQLQESNIDRILSINEEFKKQIMLLVEQIKTWQENQLKVLENSTEEQIKKFQEELTKADAHYKQGQLDNQIYFYLLDYPKQQRSSEESFKNTQRFLNQKMKDYQQLTELLTSKNWNLQTIFQTSQGQYCLPKATQPDIIFEICQEHKEKKNQLYIYRYSKRDDIGKLSCTKCLMKNYFTHNVSSIRNVSDLINEEKQKIAQYKEEFLNFQFNLTKLVDQKLQLIMQKQKEYNEYFEPLKVNILFIENEFIQKLVTTPQCDFIQPGIDYNKLFLTHADIQRQFQNEMKIIQNKFETFSIAQGKPANLFQHEKINNQQADEIKNLRNTVEYQNNMIKSLTSSSYTVQNTSRTSFKSNVPHNSSNPKIQNQKKQIPKTQNKKQQIPKTQNQKQQIPKTQNQKLQIPKTQNQKQQIPKTQNQKQQIPKTQNQKQQIPKTQNQKLQIPKTQNPRKNP